MKSDAIRCCPHGFRPAKRHKRKTTPKQGPSVTPLDAMLRLLTEEVEIAYNDQTIRVPALEAIVLQLLQLSIRGDTRAHRLMLKFMATAYAQKRSPPAVSFVDSDYTRALAGDGEDKSHG